MLSITFEMLQLLKKMTLRSHSITYICEMKQFHLQYEDFTFDNIFINAIALKQTVFTGKTLPSCFIVVFII